MADEKQVLSEAAERIAAIVPLWPVGLPEQGPLTVPAKIWGDVLNVTRAWQREHDHSSPNARPLWMGDLANRILESWPAWEAEAEQESQVAQDADTGQYRMLALIEQAVAEEYAKA